MYSPLTQSKVHLIGVGGIGMSGLAEVLYNMGAQVTGSDLRSNEQTERLKELGVPIFQGHQPSHLGACDVVVYSSAVQSSNSEYQEAKRRKIPLIPRAEALAEMLRLKRGVAIAGTHGKTTTTSLAASAFLSAKADPTIVVGGRLDIIKSNALLGQGDWMIVEADESDGSFNKLSPEIVVITNIDNDHIDFFGSFERLQSAFYEFAQRIPFYGAVIVYGDDERLRQMFEDFPKKVLFYGFNENNDYQLVKTGASYSVLVEKNRIPLELPLPGDHNALNGLAALICTYEAGIEMEPALEGLKTFLGVGRRFERKGESNGVTVFDDYGHHPTEIEAVLKTFKENFPKQRLVVAFQPHRYSRTKICWDQFLTCLSRADVLFIADIYAAGEEPIEGINSGELVRQIQHSQVQTLGPVGPEALERVSEKLRSGDIFLTLGAGDIWHLGAKILEG